MQRFFNGLGRGVIEIHFARQELIKTRYLDLALVERYEIRTAETVFEVRHLIVNYRAKLRHTPVYIETLIEHARDLYHVRKLLFAHVVERERHGIIAPVIRAHIHTRGNEHGVAVDELFELFGHEFGYVYFQTYIERIRMHRYRKYLEVADFVRHICGDERAELRIGYFRLQLRDRSVVVYQILDARNVALKPELIGIELAAQKVGHVRESF